MKWRYQLALMVVRTKFKILSAFSKSKAAKAAFDLFCTPPSRYSAALTPTYSEAELLAENWEGYRLRGFRWNKGAARKALIIHGFQSSAVNFEAYVKPLTDAGMEVLAFDAPAHGGSSGKRVNVLIYRNFIRFIEQQYGPFDAVLAHSLGGLALCLALEDWPDKKIPRVVLVAPATETKTAVNQFFQAIRIKDQKVIDAFNDIIEKIGNHPVDWFSIRRIIQSSPIPLLWIHDENDDVTPIEDAEKAWQLSSGIQVIRTKGLGHRKIYRDAGVVREAVTYLSKG